VRLSAQGAFADGTLVGVEHDADGLTLGCRAGGVGAGGGGGEQLGEQRVLLAQALVGDDRDLAVAELAGQAVGRSPR
jgi:hypothetical protein